MLASPFGFSRIGIVVPRHRHSAVDRNRLKRRLRELVRIDLLPPLRQQPAPLDIAIRAATRAYDAQLDELQADIRAIVSRVAAAPGA
jgi:ribonuclease P protein component